MGLVATKNVHHTMRELALRGQFLFFDLADKHGTYGAAAVSEHKDCLELHLSVERFGPGVVRAMRRDLAELERMARAKGKTRIVGLRMEDGPTADARWSKFTRLFGFTGQRVYQTAELALDVEAVKTEF